MCCVAMIVCNFLFGSGTDVPSGSLPSRQQRSWVCFGALYCPWLTPLSWKGGFMLCSQQCAQQLEEESVGDSKCVCPCSEIFEIPSFEALLYFRKYFTVCWGRETYWKDDVSLGARTCKGM